MVLTNAVRGVSSEGFMTIVHPQARAGATFQDLGRHEGSVSGTGMGEACLPHVDWIVPWDAGRAAVSKVL